MANPEHPRLIIHDFLSPDICKELEFIHKSCCTVGYRPNVFSTTLSHLIATNCAHFIMPFVPIRERLKEKVEEFFGCEFELFVEFTGLISWSRGASIGWHSDDNRPYLKQRDFAITDGERLTLTLWFSRDGSHDEDAKLISFLSQRQLHHSVHEPYSFLPVPASSEMYWFPPDQASTCKTGFSICFARIHALGYDLCPPQDDSCFSAIDSSNDETLMEPLRLMKEDELFDEEFVNILHILQAVQFHRWKASELHTLEHKPKVNVVLSSQSQREQAKRLKHLFLKDEQLAETLFGCVTRDKCQQHPFSWVNISAAITAWETYCSKLGKEMIMSLRFWRTHQSIYSVPSSGLEDGTET